MLQVSYHEGPYLCMKYTLDYGIRLPLRLFNTSSIVLIHSATSLLHLFYISSTLLVASRKPLVPAISARPLGSPCASALLVSRFSGSPPSSYLRLHQQLQKMYAELCAGPNRVELPLHCTHRQSYMRRR